MHHFTRPAALGAAAALTVALLGLRAPSTVLAVRQAHAQQASLASAPTTVSAAGITLRSVTVELPGSDRMFPGADADALSSNCLACHSAGMVLNQPAISKTAWQQEVDKMRSQYKAPIDEADVPAIVAYLANHKGAP
jgi:hypothetical protein